jgi:hypothetical protein
VARALRARPRAHDINRSPTPRSNPQCPSTINVYNLSQIP